MNETLPITPPLPRRQPGATLTLCLICGGLALDVVNGECRACAIELDTRAEREDVA